MGAIKRLWSIVALFTIVALVLWQSTTSFNDCTSISFKTLQNAVDTESWCPLPDFRNISRVSDGLRPSSDFESYKSVKKQVERLSAAVQIPTETFDDNGDVDVDPRWEPFDEFRRVLRDLFPLVYKRAKLEKVNRYGLIYTLHGRVNNLKPVLLTAHQDVVPAFSPSEWMHPPFEPFFDGQYLWGRGSDDCKNNLIGVLSVVEALLEQNWRPRRSVVLAFGFDEETGGMRGAAKMAEVLERTWGRDGFTFILDEGGMGLNTVGNVVYARPGVAEKGYMDALLTLEVGGGHSSRPPVHSGIGIMAEIVVALEQHPFTPILTHENPFKGYLECQAKHSPQDLESWLGQDLARKDDGSAIGKRLADGRGPEIRFSMQTSQAIDVIRGGDKVNALPESVSATINYRIAPHDSLNAVKSHITEVVQPIAGKYGIKVSDFYDSSKKRNGPALKDASDCSSPLGTLYLKSLNDLAPSPVSSTKVQNDVWRYFSATIQQVFEDTESLSGKTVIPVGDLMQANSDTIHYWNLTKNIYRFSPAREGTQFHLHAVDEHVDMTAHVEAMRFYYDLLRNFDAIDV